MERDGQSSDGKVRKMCSHGYGKYSRGQKKSWKLNLHTKNEKGVSIHPSFLGNRYVKIHAQKLCEKKKTLMRGYEIQNDGIQDIVFGCNRI